MDSSTENKETCGKIWELILNELRNKYTQALIDVWFKKLTLVYFDDKFALLTTEDKGFVNLLNTKYAPDISNAMKTVMNLDVHTEIFYGPSFSLEGFLSSLENSGKEENEKPASNDGIDNIGADKVIPLPTLDNYTFENFIVGSSNKFAHAVSIAVANSPAEQYNPLFIYGASGLGKTHLIKAIANRVSRTHPEYKIVFVKGDDFANEMIAALANKTMPQFKEKYRKVDILLVDDVQFIGGKVSIQEEFFHTINTLIENNKQIILTSDRPPKEIQHLEDRIRSRFEGGMIADIQPPDTELRIAIIKSKCEMMNIHLSDDVLTFIGENVKGNVRQIEGIIKKLGAYTFVNGCDVTVDIAKEQLSTILTSNVSPEETAEKIIQNVANIYNVSVEDIKSKKRSQEIALARHVAIYVIKNSTQLTQTNIAKIFNRDHATIISSLEVVKEEMEEDPTTERIVSNLLKDFKN